MGGSSIGAMASIVDHGRSSLLFRPGNHNDLCAQVDWMLSHPQHSQQMRQEARRVFESKYAADANHKRLMEICSSLITKTTK